MIESSPGAKIFIDGVFAGSGRLKLKKPPGLYVVRGEKPGYEPALFRVDLRAGKTSKKIAELKPLPVAKPEPKPKIEPIKEESSDVAAAPEFYETWWFWTAVGAVVVSATTVGIVVGSGDAAGVSTGDLQISVDPASAWRDYATRLGGTP